MYIYIYRGRPPMWGLVCFRTSEPKPLNSKHLLKNCTAFWWISSVYGIRVEGAWTNQLLIWRIPDSGSGALPVGQRASNLFETFVFTNTICSLDFAWPPGSSPAWSPWLLGLWLDLPWLSRALAWVAWVVFFRSRLGGGNYALHKWLRWLLGRGPPKRTIFTYKMTL